MCKHILIVDDSKTVRNLVAFVLKKEGYRVTAAADGLDGLEKLYADSSVDLVISDVNMPGMDGFTFLRILREQEEYRNLPVIILSTESRDEDIRQGMRLGANLYLVKPANPDSLARNVKMLLGIR
jgi:two-component system, chemotaxis family, chemotaxis protein CheY